MIIAFDCGKTGGIAYQFKSGKVISEPMPETRKLLLESVRETVTAYIEEGEPKYAVIEKVWSSPQMGVVSAFNFGCQYERILMLLTVLQIPFEEVSSMKWQNRIGIKRRDKAGGETITHFKTRLLSVSQELFPAQFNGLNKTKGLKICDALLILHYTKNFIMGGQSKDYSKKINEAYEGKPKEYTPQTEMNLGEEKF